MAKRGPFTVERIEFDDFANEGRMSVRVREYPAGALLEFDLPEDAKAAVVALILGHHAAKLDELNVKAMESVSGYGR